MTFWWATYFDAPVR